MDFTNNITFIINNKQYYLHYDLVKELPLFEELKKSDKLETIEYPGTINHEEITLTFNLMYDTIKTFDNVTIDNAYKIYQFMMYLTINKPKIKQTMSKLLKNINHEEIVDYGIQNKFTTSYFKKFPFYKDNWLDGIGAFILNFKKDDNIKAILINKTMKRFESIRRYTYAADVLTSEYYCGSDGKSCYRRFGGYFYSKIFSQGIKCEIYLNEGILISVHVNGKGIKIVDADGKYHGLKIYNSMLNHIKQILLGQETL